MSGTTADKAPHEDVLLSVAQVADRLTVSIATVHRLIAIRDLGHIRIGRRVIRVPEPALQAYVAERTVRGLR